MNNDLFKADFKRDAKHAMSSIEISQHILSYKNLKKLNRALLAMLPPPALLLPVLIGAVSVNVNAAIRDGSTGKKITISSPDVGASNYSPNGIAIGNGSYIENMGPDTKEGIAIGTNAKALDGNSTPRTGFGAILYGKDRKNLPGGVSGIAIGLNTYANESTVDIGAKSGGSEANGANRRASVTVGADSYAAAHFSTITGAYSSIKTTPSRDDSPSLSGFGSVISGALNTMDVKKYGTYNGMANAITGTANVIENSNGALIMGAGNKISNSQLTLRLSETPDYDNITNPNKLYDLLSKEDSNGKKPELASVGIFGGANEVDNSHFVNVSGVDNRLKGAESGTSSEYVSIDGYRNRATNVSHLSMQGSENTVTNATENIVMGNYNNVLGDNVDRSDAKRNVVLGFQDKDANKIGKNISNNQLIGSDITVKEGTKNAVLIGDQAEIAASNVDNTTALDGAVAMGAKSVANRQAIDSASVDTSTDQIPENDAAKTNKVYALKAASDADKAAVKKTVKGNLAAVSVGNANNTRQIINVAAGSADTDAVNVAQLRSVATHYYHVNTTGDPNYNNDGATGKNSMAAGKVTASGENSLAVGIGAAAKNINSISIGKTNIYGDNAIGLGSGYAAAKNAIVIGNGAVSDNMGPLSEEGIAIGTNAKSLDSVSRSFLGMAFKTNALPNGVGGIAIGANTYANQGTIDIGMKKATGPHPAAPSRTVVGSEGRGANRRAVTSVGTESYAAAHFSSIFGSYSSITSDASVQYSGLPTQGFASSITGTLNTIKANSPSTQTAAAFDGMANAINGTANVIEHSNGALIMGVGNKISNSLLPVSIYGLNYSMASDPEAFNKKLNTPNSNGVKPALASVGIFGGANEVDNSHYVNVSGVDNQLKGETEGASSEFVSIDGYMNRATNVRHLSEQGSHNKVTNAEENIVMGNYNNVLGDNVDRSDAKRNVVLGFQDKDANKIGKNISNNQLIGSDITVKEGTKNAVLIGDQAEIAASNVNNTTALDGAVALGAKSKADRQALDSTKVQTVSTQIAAGQAAKTNTVYALATASEENKKAIRETVKGNLAAVSVGNKDNTRQITNVAAGSEDTDAVNVAQLRSVATTIQTNITNVSNSTWKVSANGQPADTIGSADTVNFENTDNNIKIVKSKKENNKVDVDMTLNDTVNIKEKVNVGGTTGASINKDGLTTNGGKGPSVTTVGVNAGNQVITNVAAGVAPTDAVNVSQLDSVRNQLNNVINTNWSMSVNDESPETVARTDTVNFNNSDNNIKLVKTRNGNKINVDMKLNDTVRIGGQNGTVINNHGIMTNGGNGPSITTSGVNAGGKRITNVAAGVAPTDAVNVSQLNGVKRQIDDVDKSARAGIAGALATANLYQAYLPGHSMVSVGVGTFRGQNAIAIGASRLSDNGHIGVKLSGMTTSQGDVGGAMTVGYQW
ncbi:YadA-like family protein [Avibacterium avium]|uniref:YadA-like family protein n=1 Tax=Avibacterium avium TaxID=751 RepID=UPI003BF82F0C